VLGENKKKEKINYAAPVAGASLGLELANKLLSTKQKENK
jgi:hypothetical protein